MKHFKKKEGKIIINKQENIKIGRVISVYKDRYIIETNEGNIKAEVSGRYRFLHYQKSEFPCTGDYVLYREIDEYLAIIEELKERRTVLDRLDVGGIGERQVLASNIDLVFVCMSLNQDFNITKLENYLSLTEGKGFETIILLTKKDLCDDETIYQEQVKEVTDLKTITISVYNEEDIVDLKNVMHGKTSVFIGSSGVGKSTLVNHLLNQDYLKTSDIRLSDAQGRHTTVSRELIKLDEVTSVIDTPGIRIVSAYNLEDNSFQDIKNLSEGCKFRDCSHNFEVGCMVKSAIDNGLLDPIRLEVYKKALKVSQYVKKREIDRQILAEKSMKKNKTKKDIRH